MTKLEHLRPEELPEYLEEEWGECTRCGLSKVREGNPIFGKGNTKDPRLMFVGEAPGRTEEIEGEVFVGRTGGVLFDILWMLDIDPDDHYFTNVIACRPPKYENPRYNRKPLSSEIKACNPRLLREIYQLQPTMIVALGSAASKTIGGSSYGVTKHRGGVIDVRIPSRVKGSLTFPMLITWHPAGVLRKIDHRLGNELPVIHNFQKIFESDNPYEQLVADICVADIASQFVRSAMAGDVKASEAARELSALLAR